MLVTEFDVMPSNPQPSWPQHPRFAGRALNGTLAFASPLEDVRESAVRQVRKKDLVQLGKVRL